MSRLSSLRIVVLALMVSGSLAVISSSPASATPTPVNVSKTAMTLDLGETQNVSFGLEEPIFCPLGTLICDVSIDFSSAFPAGITVSPTVLRWADSEWMQTRGITVTVDANATLNPGETYTSSAVVVSSSEFYSNYQPVMAVTLPAQEIEDPSVVELAGTGGVSQDWTIGGLMALAVGVLFRIISVKKSKKR